MTRRARHPPKSVAQDPWNGDFTAPPSTRIAKSFVAAEVGLARCATFARDFREWLRFKDAAVVHQESPGEFFHPGFRGQVGGHAAHFSAVDPVTMALCLRVADPALALAQALAQLSPAGRRLLLAAIPGWAARPRSPIAREGADVAINYFLTEEPDAQEVIELIKAEGRKGLALPAAQKMPLGPARCRAFEGSSAVQPRRPAS